MSCTVAIATLGCKTNQFESAAMEEHLREAGFTVIPFEKGAALVIVNTCTVTAATDSQSRNLIRRARRYNPACRVVVTGCYAQVAPEALVGIPGVAVVLGNAEKKDFLSYLATDAGKPVVAVSDIFAEEEAVPLTLTSFAERSRAFLQIQNGCDAFCSYCIIPYARGRSRSVPPDAILAQIRALAGHGYPEIVLTGIHIGGYGADLAPATSLLALVQRIEQEAPVPRLRLGSIEPTEIPDQLIERIAESKILCPHFHIPLQAGSDAVLRRMHRHYATRFFRDLLERIHHRIPAAAIGLDLITGFPGETEAEFQETLDLLEDLPLSHLHVFPFSRRPGTPAASMPGQLPGDLIKARAAQLRALGDKKHLHFAEAFVGKVLDLVVESGCAKGFCRGLSPQYLTVRFPGSVELQGRQLAVKVTGWADGLLQGVRL